MSDVSGFLSGRKPRTKTVGLCPDTELLSEIVRLAAEARQTGGSLADDVEGRLEDLRSEAERSQYRFTVRAVGRGVWATLESDHQPDPDKRLEFLKAGTRLDWDPDTFPPAAVAACLTEATNPAGETAAFDKAKVEDGQVVVDPNAAALVETMWFADPEDGGFEFGECAKLWQAVNELNTGVANVPKSVNVSGATRTTPLRSVPPETSERPEVSSVDGGSLAG